MNFALLLRHSPRVLEAKADGSTRLPWQHGLEVIGLSRVCVCLCARVCAWIVSEEQTGMSEPASSPVARTYKKAGRQLTEERQADQSVTSKTLSLALTLTFARRQACLTAGGLG